MNKKQITFIIIGILLFSSLTFYLLNDKQTIEIGTYTPEQFSVIDNAYTPAEWFYDGDTVYIDDEHAYIKATAVSNNPIIELTSKQFTGDINIVFGFNTEQMRPTKAEYNPHLVDIEKSYTCDYQFNYTTSPNYFWCYEEIVNANGTTTNIVFEHSFETGDLPSKTAYWIEQETQWNDVSGAFNSIDFEFQGMNKWYYKQNFPIVAGETETLKLTIDYFEQLQSINEPSHKYWIAFYPSSETIQEAIANDHFYALDPWTEELNSSLQSYYKFDEQDTIGNGTIFDSFNGFNCKNFGADNSAGKINTAYDYNDTNSDHMDCIDTFSIASWNELTYSMWVKTVDGGEVIFTRDNTSNDYFKFRLRIGTQGGVGAQEMGVQEWSSGGASTCTKTATNINDDNWHLVIAVWDYSGNSVTLYLDNNSLGSCATDGNYENPDDDYTIGYNAAGGSGYFDGSIDEIGFWNRSLNTSERNLLWNDGDGLPFGPPFIGGPPVTLNYPTNNQILTILNVDFNCSIGNGNLTNVTLYIDGVLNETNTSGVGDIDYIFPRTLSSSGNYNYTCEACNSDGNCTKPNDRLFSIQLNLTGTVKDSDLALLSGASIFVVNQSDNSLVGNTTSNGTGFWTFGPMNPGTYIVTGYDPSNTTLDGDSEPHIVVP